MENLKTHNIKTLEEFAKVVDYSLMSNLSSDPQSTFDGNDHKPREVLSGHYVPVKPTPIENPNYITHSKIFFKELGLDDSLAKDDAFVKMFSADLSNMPKPLEVYGWATGYALSIYGTEYYDQCPFKTGNGYGDGRAISVFEGILNGKRWEMQLKGSGKTPYCRGADGRAVLRSSIREFLAQEHMYALGIATTRGLSLYVSESDTVHRPWFREGSYSKDPEVMIDEKVAIATRVASSFIRVGQLELFGRRARKKEHSKALEELTEIVLHAIDREYMEISQKELSFEMKIIQFAKEFRNRLTSLVASWIRVGYCQGNFNSDNCSVGGFTLDYGPFGFMDMFDPRYQPWTGGGAHFSFFNQHEAARQNFNMFCKSLEPLLVYSEDLMKELEAIKHSFRHIMYEKLEKMWIDKLGLSEYNEELLNELIVLMIDTGVDYTIFFRELSNIPDDMSSLVKSFYGEKFLEKPLMERWINWFDTWKSLVKINSESSKEELSKKMKKVNPKYTLREWLLVPAYNRANHGDYKSIHELQKVMTSPYEEQTREVEEKYYKEKPDELFDIAGVSHVSCSS